MKRIAAVLVIFVLMPLALSSCAAKAPTPSPGNERSLAEPAFFEDIGKTLDELRAEYPKFDAVIRTELFPDAAAVCFGKPDGDFAYFLFGGQDGRYEDVINSCGDQIKCCGFLTTAGTLFPGMIDEMTFTDFFSLIGVTDYDFIDEEGLGEGWLIFLYNSREVWVNTNVDGWIFTGAETVKSDAPVSITDIDLFEQNQDLADFIMFG